MITVLCLKVLANFTQLHLEDIKKTASDSALQALLTIFGFFRKCSLVKKKLTELVNILRYLPTKENID